MREAASKLYVSQPALSASIWELEKNRMRKKTHLIFMLVAIVVCITSCGSDKIKSRNVEDYEQLENEEETISMMC